MEEGRLGELCATQTTWLCDGTSERAFAACVRAWLYTTHNATAIFLAMCVRRDAYRLPGAYLGLHLDGVEKEREAAR